MFKLQALSLIIAIFLFKSRPSSQLVIFHQNWAKRGQL